MNNSKAVKPKKSPLHKRTFLWFKNRPILSSLFLVNIIVFVLFGGALEGSFNGSKIDPNFLLSASTIAERPWAFVTSAFMHVGILHLFINMYFLTQLLKIDEKNKDLRPSYLLIYLLSIIGSSGAVLLFSNPETPTAGASGAIFGVLGLMATYSKLATYRIGIIVTVALNAVIAFFLPFISWQAHLGGFIFGMIGGIILSIPYNKKVKIKRKQFEEKIRKSRELYAPYPTTTFGDMQAESKS